MANLDEAVSILRKKGVATAAKKAGVMLEKELSHNVLVGQN